ncbi:hypothetical protein TL16_g10946 [Triparma laevis f. inornata]|uniref:Uncharacterized protein n=1 Tax=Triparma laevis f. inornata TaxID=1714386 RepID=A0A9W7EQE0_9STRA|nr:hypothetical protein TL16_g10946 [Triparma laevis f. inornata]
MSTPLVPPTTSTITKIGTDSIRKIVAGQVVTDLSGAVKELLENSLDSGAKSIKINLHNQGLDKIEVIDDGTGVPPSSRPLLCEKHSTSKLQNFSDLYSDGSDKITTLGFRGEALFSLAQLSDGVIFVTKVKEESIGQKLEFGRDGKPISSKTSKIARSTGTTAIVVSLFSALPVRRVDLQRRIKSQRVKLFRMLQAYAITCVGVKIQVNDVKVVKGKGGENVKMEVKLSTGVSKKVQQTVTSVLGGKFLKGMEEFQCELDEAIKGLRGGLSGMEGFGVKGLVARAPTGELSNNAARDLQFFSVNGRPVDIPNFTKAISDAWRNFDTTGKKPAVVLDVKLPNSMFDVNLSPDKREVFMSDEAVFCEVMREKLMEFWGGSDGRFVSNEVEDMSKKTKPPLSTAKSAVEKLKAMAKGEKPKSKAPDPMPPKRKAAPTPTEEELEQEQEQEQEQEATKKRAKVSVSPAASNNPAPKASQKDLEAWRKVTKDFNAKEKEGEGENMEVEVLEEEEKEKDRSSIKDKFLAFKQKLKNGGGDDDDSESEGGETPPPKPTSKSRKKMLQRIQTTATQEAMEDDFQCTPGDKEKGKETVDLQKGDFKDMEIIGQFNLGFILAMDNRNQNLWILDQHGCDEKFNFERMITSTVIHEQRLIAPLPLELSPSEEDCVLENMEMFEANGFRFSYDETNPPRQRLSLTALPHSGSGGDGKRAVQFGPDDVGALCNLLGAHGASSVVGLTAGTGTGADGSGMFGNNAVRRHAGGTSLTQTQGGAQAIVRLPKAVAMFASRACRHSIMIGTALSKKEMVQIVEKMVDVEQPWACPHGRPTCKHVSHMVGTLLDDEEVLQEIWTPTGESLSQLS